MFGDRSLGLNGIYTPKPKVICPKILIQGHFGAKKAIFDKTIPHQVG